MNVSDSRIAIITAIFGDYDLVKPVPLGFDEAVLVSDKPIKSDWENVVVSTSLSPRLAAKIPKFRPDMFVSSSKSVWIDSSMSDPTGYLHQASLTALLQNDFVVFPHPERSSVREEVPVSLELPKYFGLPISAQFESYQAKGFPDNIGLWAATVIARNHTEQIAQLGSAWFLENSLWTIQDQISLPYLVWKYRISVGTYNAHLWNGPLVFTHHNYPNR